MIDKASNESPVDRAGRLLSEINQKIFELSNAVVKNPEVHSTRGTGATAMLCVVSEVITQDALSTQMSPEAAKEARDIFLATLAALRDIQANRLVPLRRLRSGERENVARDSRR